MLPENGSVHEVMRRPLLFQSITPPNIRRDKIKEDPANPRSSRFFKGNLDASIRLNINGILSLILQDQPPGRQEYPEENPATGQTFRKQLALDLLAIRDNEIVIKWSYPLRNVSLYRGIDPDGRARPFMQITEVEENPAGAGGGGGAGAGAMEGGRRRKRTRTKRRKSKSKKSRRR